MNVESYRFAQDQYLRLQEELEADRHAASDLAQRNAVIRKRQQVLEAKRIADRRWNDLTPEQMIEAVREYFS